MIYFDWGPDVTAMHEYIYSLIDFKDATALLDIGCGKGYDLFQFGQRCSAKAKLVGIDSAFRAIKKAKEITTGDSRFILINQDISSGLPFANESFDVIYSNNVLECIRDKDFLISEVCRVLKPHGQVIFCHFDWDTQIINGTDKQLIRKMINAFSDWTQEWMTVSDGWMGRRMLGVFNHNKGFTGKIIPYVLINTEFNEKYYGYQRIMDFKEMAKKGIINDETLNEIMDNIDLIRTRGEYFYSITMYIYKGRKYRLNNIKNMRSS